MKRFLILAAAVAVLAVVCVPIVRAQNFNLWQPQGVFISHAASFWPGQPTVLYEGNSQLGLSGTIFKIWYCDGEGTTGTYYAEWDGVQGHAPVQSPSNPIVSGYGFGPKIFKYSGTYYMYAQTNWAVAAIGVLTSPDGVTWTLQNASAITPDSGYNYVNQMGVIGPDSNGIFWGYYDDVVSGTSFSCGQAQSTDLIHWTQNGVVSALSNGTLASGATWHGSGNLTFAQVGGTYYAWSQTTVGNAPWPAVWDTPSDILRWSAPAANGPWTPAGNFTYYRTLSNEGVGVSPSQPYGQVADPSVVQANGNTYIFYTATPDGRASTGTGRTFDINYAIANVTIAQLVGTNEGIQNIPAPFPGAAGTQSLSLNFATLASDNFVRGSLGTNWTQAYVGSGFTVPTITSNKVTSASLAFADAFYNATTFPNAQWSQITIQAGDTGSNAQWNALTRTNAGATGALYEAIVFGQLGTGSESAYLQRYAAGGAGTNLGNFPYLTPATGDKLTIASVGSNQCLYYNGFLVLIVSDSTLTAGAAGMGLKPGGAGPYLTSLNGWSAGGFLYNLSVGGYQGGAARVGVSGSPNGAYISTGMIH